MARLVRWVGHPSPLESLDIQRLFEAGRAPLWFVDAISRFEKNYRLSVIPRQSTYTAGIQHGLSRDYQWGPDVFEQLVEEADWQILTRHPLDRVMFQDLSGGVSWLPPPLTGREWESLMSAFVSTPPPRVFLSSSG